MSRASYIKATEEIRGFDIIHLFKCIGVSYVLSIILLFMLSIGATIWDMGSGAVSISIWIITGISIIYCSMSVGKRAGRGGLLKGICAGLLYTAILYAIGGIITGSMGFNGATVTALLTGIICGGAGGVLGVNAKKRR